MQVVQVPQKKTVLQIIDSMYRGGAQKVVLEVVRALPEYKHIVCYWSKPDDLLSEFETEGAIVVQFPFKNIFSFPKAAWFLRGVVKKYNVDIIHTHMLVPNLIASLLKSKSLKTIRTYHGESLEAGGIRGIFFRLLERLTINQVDSVIAVSTHVKNYLRSKLGIDRNIELIYNFGATPTYTRLNRPFNLPITFVSTSNNQPYKNYPLIIEAFKNLQHLPIKLCIYGKGMDTLKALVAKEDISNITILGESDKIYQLLPEYDVFLIASHSGEGFSLALLEAMNAALPIVCSNLPQFLEAVDNAAFIFESKEVSSLESAIIHVVQIHSQLTHYSQRILDQSRKFSQARFRLELQSLYTSLIKFNVCLK